MRSGREGRREMELATNPAKKTSWVNVDREGETSVKRSWVRDRSLDSGRRLAGQLMGLVRAGGTAGGRDSSYSAAYEAYTRRPDGDEIGPKKTNR
jgi:hypothetical protein